MRIGTGSYSNTSRWTSSKGIAKARATLASGAARATLARLLEIAPQPKA